MFPATITYLLDCAPDIIIEETDVPTSERIIRINITNKEDNEAARNIRINLKAEGGTLKGPQEYSYPGEIGPKKEVMIAGVWKLVPEERGSCEVKLNLTVKGEFKETPDSGQAVLNKSFNLPCHQCSWKGFSFEPCYYALHPFKSGKEPWNDPESKEAWVEIYSASSFKCMDGEACAYFYNFPTERPCVPPRIELEDEIFVKIDKNDNLHYYDTVLGKVTPSEVTYNHSWAECCGSIGRGLSCDTGWIHGSTIHTFRYTRPS
jgi:hypothetical protein